MTENTSDPQLDKELGEASNDKTEDVQDLKKETSATTGEVPEFGWSRYAERVNGRFAMLGFIAVLVIETISHSGFFQWAGLTP